MPLPRPLHAWLHTLDGRLASGPAIRSLALGITALLLVSSVTATERRRASQVAATAAAPAPEQRPDGAPATVPEATGTAATAPGPATPAAISPLARQPTGRGDGPEESAAAGTRSTATTNAPPPRTPARARFESAFPSQARASESGDDPASTRWAVLIGINEHRGTTRDNLTSRQDAEDLAAHLRSLGWRDDHVLLLTDADATRENIVEALRWLARSTSRSSVAVLHYSGHTKQWPGRDVDGDGEAPDEALWPSDNRFLLDSDLVRLMRAVPAARVWLNIAACEAAGFADPGLAGPGRLLTFSSREVEKSYEDPSRGNTVWGHHLIEEGMLAGHADRNGDGTVSVEEAFAYASPRAAKRTQGQRYGAQHPVVSDGVEGQFDLRIPRPAPRPRPSESERGCTLLLCPRSGSSRR